MSELLPLCKTGDVTDDEPFEVEVEGLPPLAVYRVEGEFFVTDNICTHGNAKLSEGFQNGNIIECPFHGGAFDIRTGEPAAFPCQQPLATYTVHVQDDCVLIER